MIAAKKKFFQGLKKKKNQISPMERYLQQTVKTL